MTRSGNGQPGQPAEGMADEGLPDLGRPTPLPPAPKVLQPKRKTLQLFGVIEPPPQQAEKPRNITASGRPPAEATPSAAAAKERVEPTGSRPRPSSAKAKDSKATPFSSEATRPGAHERVPGPPPPEPSATLAKLEPLIAWMEEERRPEFFRQIVRGELSSAIAMLNKQKERYPKNITIGRALAVVEDAAAAQLLHNVGFPQFEVVVTSEPSRIRPGSPLATLLKIARSSSTLAEVLERAPWGKLKTLELISDLMSDGVLIVRAPPAKRPPRGFGRGGLSTPVLDPSRDSSPDLSNGREDEAEPPRLAEPTETGRQTLPDAGEIADQVARMRDELPAVLGVFGAPTLPPPPGDAGLPHDIAPPTPPVPRVATAALEARHPDSPEPPAALERSIPLADALAQLDSVSGDAFGPRTPAAGSLEIATDDFRDAARSAAPPATREAAREDAPRSDEEPAPESVARPALAAAPEDDAPAEKDRSRKSELHTTIRSRTVAPDAEEPPKKGPSLLVITTGLAGLAAIVSVISLVVVMSQKAAVPSEPIVKTVVVSAAAPPPPTGAPEQAPPAPSSAAPAAATVVLEVEVSPKYAQVYLDGVLLPLPIKQTLQRDGKSHELRVEAGGYRPLKKTFEATGDSHFVLSLEPRAAAPTPQPGTYDD